MRNIDDSLKIQLLFSQLCVLKNFENIGLIGSRDTQMAFLDFFLLLHDVYTTSQIARVSWNV